MLMKMLHIRVVQLASNRIDMSLPVNVWVDECKYMLCPSVINALGTARDKNCRLFLTNQSNADFEAVSMHFPSSAIREIINDNTPFKACYATRNRVTAQAISEHCGTKDGIAASSLTSVNEMGTETPNGERHVSKVEEPIFHPNLIQNLPRGMAILSGIVSWPILAIIPTIVVQKCVVPFYEATPLAAKQGKIQIRMIYYEVNGRPIYCSLFSSGTCRLDGPCVAAFAATQKPTGHAPAT